MGNKKRKIPQVVKDIQEKSKNLKVDYSKHNYISFSQYQVYRKCPYLWYSQYVENKIPFEYNIHYVFGTSIHNITQKYLIEYYNKSAKSANSLDLVNDFKHDIKEVYLKSLKKNKNKHFSNLEEFNEFYEDGLNIIEDFKKNKGKFFNKKNEFLVGIELPIIYKIKNNLYIQGFLDVVIYNILSDTFTIYDIKTSTKGWGNYNKKDKVKSQQLLLYKRYFSKIYEIPEEKIDVEFIILKRKIKPNSIYPALKKYIQSFKPVQGKTTTNRAEREFLEFIDNSFDENGKPIVKKHEPNLKSCLYCSFKDLCEFNKNKEIDIFEF